MEEQEVWQLGPAEAVVTVAGAPLQVRLRGVVTARVCESLFARLWRMPGAWRAVTIDDGVLMAVTCKSAAMAASRGAPVRAARARALVVICTSQRRLPWAVRFCAYLTSEGLTCAASSNPALDSAAASGCLEPGPLAPPAAGSHPA